MDELSKALSIMIKNYNDGNIKPCDLFGHNFGVIEQRYPHNYGVSISYIKVCSRCGLEEDVKNRAKNI